MPAGLTGSRQLWGDWLAHGGKRLTCWRRHVWKAHPTCSKTALIWPVLNCKSHCRNYSWSLILPRFRDSDSPLYNAHLGTKRLPFDMSSIVNTSRLLNMIFQHSALSFCHVVVYVALSITDHLIDGDGLLIYLSNETVFWQLFFLSVSKR